MNETTELIVLPPKETALQVYSTPQGLEPYLAKIKEELDSFVPDVTTKKGRDAIASIAYKVAKGKTALAVTLIAKKAIPAVSITY